MGLFTRFLLAAAMVMATFALNAQCATENFSNLPTATSGSYLARSWTGTDGVTWTALGARTDQTLNGKAICFGTSGTRSVTSPTYTGGLGVLSFNYVRAFTGTGVRTLQVYINGIQVGTDISVSPTSNTVVAYSATHNIAGNIVVEIRSTGASQVIVDDITWTCYSAGLDANFTASTTSICQGNTVTYTNSSTGTTGSATYAWDFGNGASPSTATGIGPHTVTYNTAGTATVELTVTDGTTDIETKTNFININALPTVNVGSAISDICQGETTASLGGSFGGSATGAVWSDGGAGGTFTNNTGTTPATATYTAALNAPASVTLTLTTTGGPCGTTSSTKSVTVNPLPEAPVANGNVSPQITNIGINDFQANWSAVSGATSYSLYVSEPSSSNITETFTAIGGGTTTSYLTRSWTGDGGVIWTAYKGRIDQVIVNSNEALTLQDASGAYLISNTINGNPDQISFDVQQKFSGSGGILTVSILSGPGFATTDVLGTIAYNSTIQNGVTFTASGITGPYQIRIDNNAAARPCIDNLQFSSQSFTPVFGSPFSTTSTTFDVTGLTADVTYEYYVVANNACGSSLASNAVNVSMGCLAPTAAASAASLVSSNTTSLDVGWTNGDGYSRIVIIKEGSASTSSPSDNTTYGANSDILLAPLLGDGLLVYNGSSNQIAVNNLTPGTEYFFTVFEYNCSPGAEKYLTTTYTFSFSTRPENVQLSEDCTNLTTHELSWSFGDGNYDGVIIFARQGATSSGPGVSDANTYIANSDYSLATDLGAKGRVVYKGSGTNVVVSGLTTGLNYSFSAYTYVNETSTIWSTGTSLSQTINISDVSSLSAVPGNTEATISWLNPNALCFDEILVVANQGAVTFTPTGDGSAYSANNIYSSSNQIVYKGTGTAVVVSGLSNLSQYCFTVYVRSGTEWSFGQEVCVVPTTVTEFEPGDLAIVSVNTQVLSSGSTDEVCFVSFKVITEGTTFFMTDNGFERVNEGLWGDTEGVARFTRKIGSGVVPAGTTICVNGPYSSDPRYDIIVCGVLDNDNWEIDPDVIGSPSGATSFDLNSTDQVWITQGGTWTNPSGSHNLSYNGTVLYGWSGIDWKDNIGNTSPTWTTNGSRLVPRTECFTTSLGTVANGNKVKYTGPMTSTTKIGWITRINNEANWTGYDDNAAYDGEDAAYDYYAECIIFPLDASSEVAGKWLGSTDDNWFNCANWDTKIVPDSTVNVTIANAAGLNSNCKVDITASNAYLYDNDAVCNDITIADKSLILESSVDNVLRVKGNLIISTGATLDMDDGTSANDGVIELSGNWTNISETSFLEGDGLVHLLGSSAQTIETSGGEIFSKLNIETAGVLLNSNITISDSLFMNNGSVDANAFTATLGLNTTTTGILEHTSGRVVGNFARWINGTPSNVLFPVGSSSEDQFIYTTFNTTSTGLLTTAFNSSNPGGLGLPLLDNDYSIQDVFTEGFWSVTNSNGLSVNSFNIQFETNGFISQTFDADTRVLYRSHNLLPWDLTGTHIAAVGSTANRVNAEAYGEFALGSGKKCLTTVSGPTNNNQILCAGDPILPMTVSALDGDGPFTYQWYFSAINNTTSGSSLGSSNGAQTDTYSPPSDFEGNGYFYCIISQATTECDPVASSTAFVQASSVLPVTVTIDPNSVTLCANSPEQTFGITSTNTGSSPVYQWYLNGVADGINSNSYTNSTLVDGDEIYAEITSSEQCTSGDIFTTDIVIINVTAAIIYYQDLDGDGYGNQSVSITDCTQPIGYVAAPVGDANSDGLPDFDCNDNEYEVSPGADEYCSGVDENCNGEIDEGINSYTFYADLDGDGFGDPLNSITTCQDFVPGYITNNTDCNDNTALAHPGLIEICDGIDNDCDAIVDEGCGPVNDDKSNALILYANNYGSCSTTTGTLIGATTSPESQSSAISGEDVWYYFTAPTSGAIIHASSTSNLILEIQTELGQLVDVENILTGSGVEKMNVAGLTPGGTYYLVIRNYNSASTINANFTVCIQKLYASRGDNVDQPVSLCSYLKADWTLANQYIFHLPFGTFYGNYATNPNGSFNNFLMLNTLPEIQYGESYPNIIIDAVYSLPDGNGTIETIVVPGVQSCTLNTLPQPSIQLKTIDQCPNSKSLGATLRAEPHLCGNIVDYEWEFTPTYPDPGLPYTAYRGANDRYFRVNWIPGVQPGMEFLVRIRPIYDGNIPGNWSTTSSCLKIIGLANYEFENPEDWSALQTEQTFGVEEQVEFNLYPNPSNGDYVTVQYNFIQEDETYLSITNTVGQEVYRKQIQSESSTLLFEKPLASGAYIVTIQNRSGVLMRKTLVVGR